MRTTGLERGIGMAREEILSLVLKENRKRQEVLRIELQECPQGRLYQKYHKAGKSNPTLKEYFVQSYIENGKQIQKGINTNPGVVIGLIKRELLEKELKSLENNEKQIEEGNESVTNCRQLKLTSPGDGKKYLTDVANTEQLFRLIQSVPSKKANLSSSG